MQKEKEQGVRGRNDKKQKEKHVAKIGEKTPEIENANFLLYFCGLFA